MEKKSAPIKKPLSGIAKLYLILYNALESVGWSFLFFNVIAYYTGEGVKSSLYDHIKWFVIILPNSAVLDILHAATGLVPSSPIVTSQMVYSRVVLTCGVILPTLAAKESIGFPIVMLAWSTIEVIRYSFYALNLLNAVPYILIWLRYTLFIVLFPLGLSGELLLLYSAQHEFGKTGVWSLQLPNPVNSTFNFQYFLIMNMLLLATGFPTLYFHMFTQRKKALGTSSYEKKTK